ncbi:MAG: DUF5063 domain-containing protein [Bacteroidales bacterium]|nr:DUF5063 domain-containing protein [Bacteroidales bacterium]
MADNKVIYSKDVVEFTTVAYEYCTFAENTAKYSKSDFLKVASKMLPLLYVKVSLLPRVEPELDDVLEDFVDEFTYEQIRSAIRAKITRHDDYLEVFKDDMHLSEVPIDAQISEDMADIYQDLKNYCERYRMGIDEISHDALAEVTENFERYWGQRLCNALRALHAALYSGDDLSDEKPVADDDNTPAQ